MENQIPNQDPINQTPIINPEPVPQEPVNTEPVEVPPRPEIEITPEPELQPQPETSAPSNNYQQVLNQYSANTDKLPPIETPPKSPEEQLQNLGISVPVKSGGGFFKAIFIIALIIFLFVAVALAFVFLKDQKNTDNSDSSSFDTIETSPTLVSGTCFLNDKTYQIGESFASADGCNTCSCESKDIITCTEKACATPTVATKSATITPTKTVTPTATISAKKITPTATPSATTK
ncbi:MAG: hypothetical protein PHE32_03430 [Candidatus Shapirobacteria bacterium]|nr:hypothetical protein [Candidatus Shapirobacteria bacterium]MDD4410725.1 hypothetical protein [Candidatus Shapirobacteria bacterium]